MSEKSDATPIPIDGFSRTFALEAARNPIPVYVSDTGHKPLILLHELPGMSHSFIACARDLADKGFRVYMPLMFKRPGTEMGMRQMRAFCISQEFAELYKPKNNSDERPFVDLLYTLVETVSAETDAAPIGVIGMCLTGGFALGTIAKSPVAAAIACQPAYPSFQKARTLGLSKQQRKAAGARAATLPKPCARGYRYRWDPMSWPAHMRGAKDMLGDQFERMKDLDGLGHSILTSDKFQGRKGYVPHIFDEIVEFLGARL